MYWAYKLWNDPIGSPFEGLYGDDSQPSSLKTAKVDVLVHPYPQAVAETPTRLATLGLSFTDGSWAAAPG